MSAPFLYQYPGIDVAAERYGGDRAEWLDLSAGINPIPYPVGEVPTFLWMREPDADAMQQMLRAARTFWSVPVEVEILPAAGISPLIARLPDLSALAGAYIPVPTYNEYAAAFAARGRLHDPLDAHNPVHVYMHPNNPDGRLWPGSSIGNRPLTIVDERYGDTTPEDSHIARAADPGVIVLKSISEFWGLPGLHLGFAMARPETFSPSASVANLQDLLGPRPVSGPAIQIGTRALKDLKWAEATRARLGRDAARLDNLMLSAGAEIVGGTTLFRTYAVRPNAGIWQTDLATHRIWSCIFPFSTGWLRLGLPGSDEAWDRLEAALASPLR